MEDKYLFIRQQHWQKLYLLVFSQSGGVSLGKMNWVTFLPCLKENKPWETFCFSVGSHSKL